MPISNQIRNPSYKEDTEMTIKLCRTFALMIGLWPSKLEDSMFQRIQKFILRFIYYLFTLFTYISTILHGIFVVTELHARLVVMGPVTFWTMLLSKYCLFWYHSNDIEKCMKNIEEDWQFVETGEQREIMMKNGKFANYITIICATFMFGGGFSYHVLVPLAADSFVTEMNITVQPFPTPAYGKFFTSGLSPAYEIIFTVQVLEGLINDTLNVMTFSLFAVLILHACGQFDIVMLHINNLISSTKENQEVVHDRLVMIVKHHLRVLRFISRLKNLLTEVCLIEVLGSTLMICLLGYYLIVACNEVELSDIVAYSVLIMSFIFNIFIYCYVAELLTTQAIKFGECVYGIQWYNLPKHTSWDLVLLIRISQFPAKITAGKFTPLSLDSFSSILKTSAAYFNFVWRMTQ